MLQRIIDKIFRDKHGKVILWQNLNLPIITWAVARVLATVFGTGMAHSLFEVIAFGALFTWAWLELFSGVNYFRRALGLVILVMTILNQIR